MDSPTPEMIAAYHEYVNECYVSGEYSPQSCAAFARAVRAVTLPASQSKPPASPPPPIAAPVAGSVTVERGAARVCLDIVRGEGHRHPAAVVTLAIDDLAAALKGTPPPDPLEAEDIALIRNNWAQYRTVLMYDDSYGGKARRWAWCTDLSTESMRKQAARPAVASNRPRLYQRSDKWRAVPLGEPPAIGGGA